MRPAMTTREAIEYEEAATFYNMGAEVIEAAIVQFLNRQSVAMLECWGGDHLNSETLLCECRLCVGPAPEPGCDCEVCRFFAAKRAEAIDRALTPEQTT